MALPVRHIASEELDTLLYEIEQAKQFEEATKKKRQELEDKVKALVEISDGQDGTNKFETDWFALKVEGHLNTKVDTPQLLELVDKNPGLKEVLDRCFKTKLEVTAAFKKEDEEIRRIFAPAITTTPGRSSFTITHKEEEK